MKNVVNGKIVRCRGCGSDDTVKMGLRRTVTKGVRQIYQCRMCARTLYAENSLTRQQALDLRKPVSMDPKDYR